MQCHCVSPTFQRYQFFVAAKYNHLFEQVKLAPMELTDFTKFSAAKLYYQYFNLHANPIVSEELDKYSWLLGASNFCLSRAIHSSSYKKNQLPRGRRSGASSSMTATSRKPTPILIKYASTMKRISTSSTYPSSRAAPAN
jgi:hypothetical protein